MQEVTIKSGLEEVKLKVIGKCLSQEVNIAKELIGVIAGAMGFQEGSSVKLDISWNVDKS